MSQRLSLDGTAQIDGTPTSTKAANLSNVSTSLDDITHLLYLETLKRFKDEENNLKRQVDEKVHQYEDEKAEYRYMFELFVRLYEEAVLRNLLEVEHCLPSGHITQADISTVAEKVSSNKIKVYLDPDMLNQCREMLHRIENYDETKEIQSNMVDQKAVVKDIRSLNEALQFQLEAATTQSLDYFVELVQAEQKII